MKSSLRGTGSWRRIVAAVCVVAGLSGACDSQDEKSLEVEVEACADLRGRENELIASANETLKELGETEDPEIRVDVLVDGFDQLIAILDAQRDTVTGDTVALTDLLQEGAESAVVEMREERAEFAESVDRISDIDERGRAGTFQNAVEKMFSHLEPPRSAYEAAGLADEIDADVACEFVTQRADPARG